MKAKAVLFSASLLSLFLSVNTLTHCIIIIIMFLNLQYSIPEGGILKAKQVDYSGV